MREASPAASARPHAAATVRLFASSHDAAMNTASLPTSASTVSPPATSTLRRSRVVAARWYSAIIGASSTHPCVPLNAMAIAVATVVRASAGTGQRRRPGTAANAATAAATTGTLTPGCPGSVTLDSTMAAVTATDRVVAMARSSVSGYDRTALTKRPTRATPFTSPA
jgi:hypothetical protein